MDDRQTHAHDHPPRARIGGGEECVLCPICVLLQALSTSRPDVMEHLAAAGRELALALQAIVDGHATAPRDEPLGDDAPDEQRDRERARPRDGRRHRDPDAGEELQRIDVE